MTKRSDHERIVITGVGLTAPNASNLDDFRKKLPHVAMVVESSGRVVGHQYTRMLLSKLALLAKSEILSARDMIFSFF